MIRNEKTYGFFRKTKKYGLIGCISFCGVLTYSAMDNSQIINKEAHAAVVNGGADIVDADVHNKETSGVAMTYTSFDSNGSKQVASGSGVFVAPNVMVTVAHNYLDKDKASGSGYVRGGNSAQSYVVMNSDAEKRNNTPANGTSDIIPKGNIHYYNQKEFAKSYENDLAAVVTERPVEAMTNGEDKPREMGVANQGDNITLVGYPNDFSSKRLSEATKARLKDGKIYKVSGTLSSLNTTTGDGTYNTSALGGFSGGPIFNDKGEVVGIHQHGTNTDAGTDAEQHGGGLFFTDKHRSWLNKIIEEHGIKGWFVNGNDKYYYDDNHRALVSTEREIDGARYSFDSNGRGRLLSGTEKGKVVLRIKNEAGEKLVERVVAQGNVGSAVNYDFKQDKENKDLFGKNPNATIVSIDGETINKKFNENWSKDFVSKLSLGNTYIDAVIKAENFVRTQPGQVDTSGDVTLPKPSDEVKNAPNGLRNFDATAIIVTPDGTGSGTLIEKDLLLTVAHNFLKFENGKVTEKATGNNDKKYYAVLPNGKKVFFTDSDIHYWKKDDSVVGFTHDLALVKFKEVVDNVTPATLKKDVSVVNSGDKVSVYGFPDGKLKPVIDTKVTDVVDRGAGLTGIGYTGTKPGASGGGLYDDKGEIIGVHQNGVVGERSGGLVFSKEQLDWVKSYIDGNPKVPVYREEKNVDYGDVSEFELKDLKDDSKLKQWFSDRIKKIGTEDKIRLSVDGNILFEKKIDTATKEYFEIKTGLYKIESIVEKEEKISFSTKYVADKELTKGEKSVIKKGIEGTLKTTYIKDEDGELIKEKETKEPPVDEIVKVGIKPTENTKEILSNTLYVADKGKERGLSNERIEGFNGYEKEVIKYILNEKDGTISETVEKTEKKATDTIIKVPAKDKVAVTEIPSPVRYEKDSTREKGQNSITIPGEKGTRKVTTTYEVNPKTGGVTEKVEKPEVKEATETVVKVAAKDKVEVTEIPSPIRYEKDSTREKGQKNITILGEKGTRKVTTTYEVNPKTGEITARTGTPELKKATDTIIKVSAKDKVEVVQRGDGKKVKVTTVYIVDEKTGNITQTKREEEISHDVVTSKSDEKVPTVELKAFAGGVNPSESVVTEELPELKVALLKDEEDNILEVLAISEKPKELKGYKYTGKEEADVEGNKIYIYEKDKSKVVTSKSDEKVPTVELKAFEGGVNPSESVVAEEPKAFEGGVNPSESVVTEEPKPFAGGVNPSESVVTEEPKAFAGGVNAEISVVKEELPELKVALLKDEEDNILEVLAISEKPKELKGYKYTGKEEVDVEGNKIYIYQKVELENLDNKKQETVDVNQSQNTESRNETTASKKAQVEKLPNTGETPVESGVLGGMLLVAITMLSKRKLKK